LGSGASRLASGRTGAAQGGVRAGLAEDAQAYNELITSWSAIESAAAREPAAQQQTLFD